MAKARTVQLSITQEVVQLVETTEVGILQVHEITRTINAETKEVIGEQHWRTTLEPTQDAEKLAEYGELLTPTNLKIAKAFWTKSVVEKYKALIEEQPQIKA